MNSVSAAIDRTDVSREASRQLLDRLDALHAEALAAVGGIGGPQAHATREQIRLLRDALHASGHVFDSEARLRLYFVDWSDVDAAQQSVRQARLDKAATEVRQLIRRLLRDFEAGVHAVALLRIELGGEGGVHGADLLRLFTLLERASEELPYLSAVPSAAGLAIAEDPSPAWVLRFRVPPVPYLWDQIRHWIGSFGLSVRVWDYRDPKAGRGEAPVCVEVTELFRIEVVAGAMQAAMQPNPVSRNEAGAGVQRDRVAAFGTKDAANGIKGLAA